MLIRAFGENADYGSLAAAIYDFAEMNANSKMKACMRELVEDRGTNKHVLDLLSTLHPEVATTVISNTYAHYYATNRNFESLFLKPDTLPGTYINAVVLTMDGVQTGAWLSGKQIRKLIALLTEYKDNAKAPTPTSKSIDKALCPRDGGQVRPPHYLTYPTGKLQEERIPRIEALIQTLEKRIFEDDGRSHGYQSPCEVGCSAKLSDRMGAHKVDNAFTKSNYMWGLYLACLTVMKLEFSVAGVPLFLIWKPEQYKIAETLGTILAGSMAEQGGLNPTAPGGSSLSAEETTGDLWASRLSRVLTEVSKEGQPLLKNMTDMDTLTKKQQGQEVTSLESKMDTKMVYLEEVIAEHDLEREREELDQLSEGAKTVKDEMGDVESSITRAYQMGALWNALNS